MDSTDKMDKSPRFIHVFGRENYLKSLSNFCLVSWCESKPRTVTELCSSVYIICLSSTVTTCVRGVRKEPPPSRTASCAKLRSAPVTVYKYHWPDTLVAISNLKIPVPNVQKSSADNQQCKKFIIPSFHGLASKCWNENEAGMSGRLSLDM